MSATGYSYAEISHQTGFNHTKVNRSPTEGRALLRQREALIERGAGQLAECLLDALGQRVELRRADRVGPSRKAAAATTFDHFACIQAYLKDRSLAEAHLATWLAWASRSKLKPFVKLARTIRRYRKGILFAIRLGLSDSRTEALNSKVRLLSHRFFGSHGARRSSPPIYLCCTA